MRRGALDKMVLIAHNMRMNHDNSSLIQYLSEARDNANNRGISWGFSTEASYIARGSNSLIDMKTFDQIKSMGLLDYMAQVTLKYKQDVLFEVMKFPELVPDVLRNADSIPVPVVRFLLGYFIGETCSGEYDLADVWDNIFSHCNDPLFLLTRHGVKDLNLDTEQRRTILMHFLDRGVSYSSAYGSFALYPDEYSSRLDEVLYRLISGMKSAGGAYTYTLKDLLVKYDTLPQDVLETALYARKIPHGVDIALPCIDHLCKLYDENGIYQKIMSDAVHQLKWAKFGVSRMGGETLKKVLDHKSSRVRSIVVNEMASRKIHAQVDVVSKGVGSSSITERRAWMNYAKVVSDIELCDETDTGLEYMAL